MCNAIKWSFSAFYVFLLATKTFGLHFSALLPSLGLPWTLFLDAANESNSLIGVSRAVLTMLAPAINLAILFSICSTLRRRRTLSDADG